MFKVATKRDKTFKTYFDKNSVCSLILYEALTKQKKKKVVWNMFSMSQNLLLLLAEFFSVSFKIIRFINTSQITMHLCECGKKSLVLIIAHPNQHNEYIQTRVQNSKLLTLRIILRIKFHSKLL